MESDLVTTVRVYRAVAQLHDATVAELLVHFGEDDIEQLRELRGAQRFFAMGRALMDNALARAEQPPAPAVQPGADRTPEPSRQSPYFPLWRG